MSALSVSKRFARKKSDRQPPKGALRDSTNVEDRDSQTVQSTPTKKGLSSSEPQSTATQATAAASAAVNSTEKKKRHKSLPPIHFPKRRSKGEEADATSTPDGDKKKKKRKSLSRKLAGKSVHLAGKLLTRHKRLTYSGSFAAVSASVRKHTSFKHKNKEEPTVVTQPEPPENLPSTDIPKTTESPHKVSFSLPKEEKIDREMTDVELGQSRNLVTDIAIAQVTGGSTVDVIKNAFIPGEKSDGAVTKVGTAAVDTVAIAGVGTSIATMALTGGKTAAVASSITTVFSPYASYQKRKCNDIGTLRAQHNRLRGNVNELMQENDKLKSNVDRLEASVSSLEDVENDLSKLANTSNLDRLVTVVKEHKRVTQNIKAALRADIMFQVMEVLMQSDRNRDFTIGPNEINMMIMRMKMVSGVIFNEKNFRAKVASEGYMTLTDIMGLFRDLEDENVDEETAIFVEKLSDLKK